MTRTAFTIGGLILALCSQALAFGEHLKEGKYVCVTDRAVGLQGERDRRYAGKIELADKKKRFFVTVNRIRDLDLNREFCSPGEDKCLRIRFPDKCWNEKALKYLKSAVEKGDDFDVRYSEYSKP